jgi:thioredoxin 1
MKPHRGSQIQTFGILGLIICMPLGIAAWVMGNNDLKEMDQGLMDPNGRDKTKLGKTLGIISVSLAALALVALGIFMIIGAGALAFGAKKLHDEEKLRMEGQRQKLEQIQRNGGQESGATSPDADMSAIEQAQAAAEEMAEKPVGPEPTFSSSYDEVMTKAKAANKPVIVIFSASWCGPCQYMKNQVYPSASVVPFHSQFEWAYLDTDEEANAEAAKKHNVEGIPHLVFMKADGTVIDNQVGGEEADAFAEKLDSVLKKAQ